jgi:hypothetical protein
MHADLSVAEQQSAPAPDRLSRPVDPINHQPCQPDQQAYRGFEVSQIARPASISPANPTCSSAVDVSTRSSISTLVDIHFDSLVSTLVPQPNRGFWD